MTHEEARGLAEFVHDHDKRFGAQAESDGADGSVLLTRVSDGRPLPPITWREQYRAEQIERDDPGPTVRAAWEAWLRRNHPDEQ